MKLHLLAAAAAFAMTAGAAGAQDRSPQGTPTPQQDASRSITTGSPTTPPTHPTERTVPAAVPPSQNPTVNQGDARPPLSDRSPSLAEAQQVCRNLTGTDERRDCMTKAERDFKARDGAGGGTTSTDRAQDGGAAKSSGGQAGATESNPTGTSAGRWSGSTSGGSSGSTSGSTGSTTGSTSGSSDAGGSGSAPKR